MLIDELKAGSRLNRGILYDYAIFTLRANYFQKLSLLSC